MRISEQSHFLPGQTILFREMWQGRPLSLRPEIVVQDKLELMAFYLPEGTGFKRARDIEGKPATGKNRFQQNWVLGDEKWVGLRRLRLAIPGRDYSVLLFWNADSSFRSWYINLENPLRRTERGFDYEDLLLDIVAVPGLSQWFWRDEDELREALDLGLISPDRAEALRKTGEQAVNWLQSGKSPFNGWEKWQPDPSWKIPVLPHGWDKL